MNKIILFITLLSITLLYSVDFEYEKINDFHQSQAYKYQSTMHIEDNILYCMSEYGLEIYQLDQMGNTELLLIINIVNPKAMTYFDNMIFISGSKYEFDQTLGEKIYQVDVTNPNEPFITENIFEFEYMSFVRELEVINGKLEIVYIQDEVYKNIFFDPYTMEPIISYDDQFGSFYYFKDNLYFSTFGLNQYFIYDMTDIENPLEVGYADLIEIHPVNCYNIQTINDSTVIAIESNKLSFWDISQPYDWELISTLTFENFILTGGDLELIGNKLFIPTSFEVILIDINDINNPILCDSTEYEFYTFFGFATTESYNNYIYLADLFNGIKKFELNENNIEYLGEESDYLVTKYASIYQNHLLLAHFGCGLTFYDITDLENITYKGLLIPNIAYSDFMIRENYLIATDYQKIDLYDITDIENPIFLDSYNTFVYLGLMNKQSDSLSFCIKNSLYNLTKIQITENNQLEEIFEINTDFEFDNFVIVENYAYLIENYSYGQRIYIYQDMNTYMPYECNVTSALCNMPPSWLFVNEDYLIINCDYFTSHNDMGVKFYSLTNPENPQFVFQTNISGITSIVNDILFLVNGNTCYQYDISDPTEDTIYPINSFVDTGFGRKVLPFERNNEKYFLYRQDSSIGVYEYEVTTKTIDTEIITIPYNLTNYPNPFNPITQISYSLPNDTVEASIEIYNIKGQEINSIECESLSFGEHRMNWNGEDKNNQAVSSGVYFYKLIINKRIVSSSKMMLIK